MEDKNGPPTLEDMLREVQAQLERRFYAAMIDMIVVAAGCFAWVQANGTILPGGVRALRGPALLLLGLLLLLEAMTGLSIGKFAMGLKVLSSGGGRATILQTTVRAGVRWIGPLISLASILTKDATTASLLLGGAVAIVICEAPCCYLALFRTGGTIFDLAARTLVRVNTPA